MVPARSQGSGAFNDTLIARSKISEPNNDNHGGTVSNDKGTVTDANAHSELPRGLAV